MAVSIHCINRSVFRIRMQISHIFLNNLPTILTQTRTRITTKISSGDCDIKLKQKPNPQNDNITGVQLHANILPFSRYSLIVSSQLALSGVKSMDLEVVS